MTDPTRDAKPLELNGNKKYQKRARRALPLLVRQAKAEQPVYYSDLADELGMPNPRNLNYVLGAIGHELLRLSEDWETEVPPIQALVVNKRTGLPGKGISSFAPDAEEFQSASARQRREIVQYMLGKVYRFADWDTVLEHFGLPRAGGPPLPFHPQHQPPPRPDGGESEAHRLFKEFVAENPKVVGLRRSYGSGEVEFGFLTADAVDVLFQGRHDWVGVEVKAANAPVSDIARGLYQCVKYHALLEATQRARQLPLNTRVMLALQSEFPAELVALRNTLGVEVVDAISQTSPD